MQQKHASRFRVNAWPWDADDNQELWTRLGSGRRLFVDEPCPAPPVDPVAKSSFSEGIRLLHEKHCFEQAITDLAAFAKENGVQAPECFVSYPWGDPAIELWVENNLVEGLVSFGVPVLFDKWDNSRPGDRPMKFIDLIETCEQVLPVLTPNYLRKYHAGEGYLAIEIGLIEMRVLRNKKVMPLLLKGSAESSRPPFLANKMYLDFRQPQDYFKRITELAFHLYGVSKRAPIWRAMEKRWQQAA